MPQMSRNEIVETIQQAGKLKKTLWIRAYESNGSIEPKEVEPYSFRPKSTTEKFFFHCLLHNGTRNVVVDKIIEVHITENSYVPRYDVEF